LRYEPRNFIGEGVTPMRFLENLLKV
jgi:hypothetical protein